MKIVAECGSFLMLIKQNEELSELTQCRVYDMERDMLSPSLPAGSWSARVSPWIKPTKDYSEQLKLINDIINKEKANNKEKDNGTGSKKRKDNKQRRRGNSRA